MRIPYSRSGNSLAETMVVLLVITVGVTGTFQLLHGGIKLASTTEARIQAISLAREGIEAVESIRNSNWVKFSSDLENCFDVADYDGGCIGNPAAPKLANPEPRVLVNTNGMWYLTGSSLTHSGIVYDQAGLSLQGTGTSFPPCGPTTTVSCQSRFSRTVKVTDAGTAGNKKIRVESTVSWRDGSRVEPYRITLEHTLTNWKKNF